MPQLATRTPSHVWSNTPVQVGFYDQAAYLDAAGTLRLSASGLLCLQAHVDYGDSPEHVVGDGNTDSPLWANAAFVVSAIGILGPEHIVPHMAPGLVAHADVLAAIRRGRASSRA